jgi:hypothetical protein
MYPIKGFSAVGFVFVFARFYFAYYFFGTTGRKECERKEVTPSLRTVPYLSIRSILILFPHTILYLYISTPNGSFSGFSNGVQSWRILMRFPSESDRLHLRLSSLLFKSFCSAPVLPSPSPPPLCSLYSTVSATILDYILSALSLTPINS